MVYSSHFPFLLCYQPTLNKLVHHRLNQSSRSIPGCLRFPILQGTKIFHRCILPTKVIILYSTKWIEAQFFFSYSWLYIQIVKWCLANERPLFWMLDCWKVELIFFKFLLKHDVLFYILLDRLPFSSYRHFHLSKLHFARYRFPALQPLLHLFRQITTISCLLYLIFKFSLTARFSVKEDIVLEVF